MKILIYFFLICLYSCAYPEIDSVPNFKELKLTNQELFDLCQLSSTDKSEIDKCIKDKKEN